MDLSAARKTEPAVKVVRKAEKKAAPALVRRAGTEMKK